MKIESNRGPSRGRRLVPAVLLALVAVALLAAAPAGAHQVAPYEFEKTIDGTGSTGGKLTSETSGIAINQASGNIYVADADPEHLCAEGHSEAGEPTVVSQFDASGHPKVFTALGTTSFCAVPRSYLVFGGAPLSFDNSGHGEGLFVGHGLLFDYNADGTLRSPYPKPVGFDYLGEGHPTTIGDVAVAPSGYVWVISEGLRRIDPATGEFDFPKRVYWPGEEATQIAVDSEGYFYIAGCCGRTGVSKFGPESEFTYDATGRQGASPKITQFGPSKVLDIAVDPATNYVYLLEETGFSGWQVTEYTPEGAKVQTFATEVSSPKSLAVRGSTHNVYVTHPGGVDVFKPGAAVTVPNTVTRSADPTPNSAVLHGTVDPEGVETTDCHFEWGETRAYQGGSVPCAEGNAFTVSEEVSAEVTNLTKGRTYHYRLVAGNGNGVSSYGVDRTFQASGPPAPQYPAVISEVNTDGATVEFEIDPNGGTTDYWLEYGEADCSVATCAKFPVPPHQLEDNLGLQSETLRLTHLTAGRLYHFRVAARNEAGTVVTPDQTFSTFPRNPTSDPCPNVQVRQQTGASLLLDCRAYELASAENAGGYDVESNAIPGQQPLEAYPEAENSLLYSLHYGAIPGVAGYPTNYGRDPYVATRGEHGWTTRYVGIPATAGQGISEPFGSPLEGADSRLTTFAFGGEGLCSPCFPDGSAGVPVHLPDGSLVQGMAGSSDPGPDAEPAGYVKKPLSADGNHLVFGSTAQFEPTGNNNGDVTIYERDLPDGGTQVVSTTPAGTTLTGSGIGELDVSKDGSRVLIARAAGPDAEENGPYELLMHIAGSAESADVTPGATAPVLFDGMTRDGKRVFFTTSEQLVNEDTDESADIYEATVNSPTSVDLRLVSIGSDGSGNGEECEPVGKPNSWNSVEGDGKCGVLAFAGGAGLAADNGTFYFLSPELLDGPTNGTENLPNLYVVTPGGSPKFVATVDSAAGKAPPGPPLNPLLDNNFGGSHSGPEALAVDQASEDVYVLEQGAGRISRYTSSGAPDNFSVPGGSNEITGLTLSGPSRAQVAVDNSGGAFDGDFYVTDGSSVDIYASSGEKAGELTTGAFSFAHLVQPCGVAVDPNGIVYVADTVFGAPVIWQYTPTGNATPVSNEDYSVKAWVFSGGFTPCALAADSQGNVYASEVPNGPTKELSASTFEAPYHYGEGGAEIDAGGTALAVDPATDNLWIDEGNKLVVLNSSGQTVKTRADGEIQGSRGVAVNGADENVYASNVSTVSRFGSEPAPYEPIDDPAILHALHQAGVRDTADFQVTPDGGFAAFESRMPVTGYLNRHHAEIYRYDAAPGSEAVACVSCAPTNAAASTDTRLTSGGLNLTSDGAVFFTSREGLVLRDTNGLADAYEWENGKTQLISTGSGTTDATLLSASADGTDAFFFTRQKLVPQDHNGNTMKVYDARKEGGFLFIPGEKPCAAADECHGPGTPIPPPPAINTVTGQGARPSPTTTRKKKPRHPRRHHHHRKHHHRKRRHVRHVRNGRNG